MKKYLFSLTCILFSMIFLTGCNVSEQVSLRQKNSQSKLFYIAVKPYINTEKVQGEGILNLKPTFSKPDKASTKKTSTDTKEEDRKTSTTRNTDASKSTTETSSADETKEPTAAQLQQAELDKAIAENNAKVSAQTATTSTDQNKVMQQVAETDKKDAISNVVANLQSVVASLSDINKSLQKQLDGMNQAATKLNEVAVNNTTLTTQKEELLRLFETKKATIIQLQNTIKTFNTATTYTAQDLIIGRLKQEYNRYLQVDLLITDIIDSWE